jgi:hypothetical protein
MQKQIPFGDDKQQTTASTKATMEILAVPE